MLKTLNIQKNGKNYCKKISFCDEKGTELQKRYKSTEFTYT